MCNLYRMTKGTAEVAALFEVLPDSGANVAEEIYPGYPGLVIAEGRARAMTWGFPLVRTGRQGQRLRPKPVTNARDDKLHTRFWKDSFVHRRCLVPVTSWAEPEGKAGRMTRTWYGVAGEETFAVAGLWRASVEWGEVYTLVMAPACAQMVDVHDRMPVLLPPRDWRTWLNAAPEEAFALCRTSSAELHVERTRRLWSGAGDLAASAEAGRDVDDTMPRLL
ncbi:SOS response-associated peptidase family protein [Novosphingobium profundi]|uniref:SOS response-associated peptidase n=1 Tax=Novosphingobium profundi TaxID=1774954 RepID=UPI001BD95F22|nr:SOS response-associated peptidase family protein [Novosphingobium profundi]MBT0669910.1 SOS response-associated peptidase family protein [Novosphingobium profundi]